MEFKSAVSIISSALLLSACGLKGPLYMPPEDAKKSEQVQLEQTKDPQMEILGRTEKSAKPAGIAEAKADSGTATDDEVFSKYRDAADKLNEEKAEDIEMMTDGIKESSDNSSKAETDEKSSASSHMQDDVRGNGNADAGLKGSDDSVATKNR